MARKGQLKSRIVTISQRLFLDGLNPKMKVDHAQHKAVCVHEGLYRDDKQVVSLKVDKYYSDNPRVEITAFWDDD